MTFNIKLHNDACCFTAGDEESVLEAALRAGIILPYGCRNGACGSCKGKLLDGQIRYRDIDLTGITPEERDRGYALFCQALPASDLVIETRRIQNNEFPPIRRLPCRVEKLEKCSDDILRLYLKLPATEPLHFFPGQLFTAFYGDLESAYFQVCSKIFEHPLRVVPRSERLLKNNL